MAANPTAQDRREHAVLPGGRFPVANKAEADSALRLRGHAGKPGSSSREAIIAAASRYDAAAAARARQADRST